MEKEEEGRKRKSEPKISFLGKFFPEANSSPGGSDKLRMRQDQTHMQRDGASERVTRIVNMVEHFQNEKLKKTTRENYLHCRVNNRNFQI